MSRRTLAGALGLGILTLTLACTRRPEPAPEPAARPAPQAVEAAEEATEEASGDPGTAVPAGPVVVPRPEVADDGEELRPIVTARIPGLAADAACPAGVSGTLGCAVIAYARRSSPGNLPEGTTTLLCSALTLPGPAQDALPPTSTLSVLLLRSEAGRVLGGIVPVTPDNPDEEAELALLAGDVEAVAFGKTEAVEVPRVLFDLIQAVATDPTTPLAPVDPSSDGWWVAGPGAALSLLRTVDGQLMAVGVQAESPHDAVVSLFAERYAPAAR